MIDNVVVGARLASSTDDPTLFDASPGGIDGARSMAVAFDSGPGMSVGDRILVEMRDPGRSGYFADRLEIASVTCPTRGFCEYEAMGYLTEEPHTSESGDPVGDVELRVVLGNGQASTWSQPTTVMGCGCDPGTTMIEGSVTYTFEECVADTSTDIDTSPQYRPSTCTLRSRPARRIMVEVVAMGTTGQVLVRDRTWASEQGSFFLTLPATAAELDHEIRVWSVTPKSPGTRIAVGAWQGADISSLSSLTDDPADYQVHSATLASFVPQNDGSPHGGSDILVWLGELQIEHTGSQEDMSWATHIIDEAKRGIDYFGTFVDKTQMHGVNIVWQSNEIGLDGSERANAFVHGVHPSLIFILPESTDSFAVNHELAHYFHREYLRNDGAYGRFKEPMANTNAGMARTETFFGSWMPAATGYDSSRESMEFNGHNKDGTVQQSNLQFFPDHASYIDCDSRPSCCGPSQTEADPLCILGSFGYVWRLFWDLHDGTGSEPWAPSGVPLSFDNVNGGGASTAPNHKLMDVLFGYLGGKKHPQNANYADRGIENTDPADVLDGMMCRGHMTEEQAEVLLQDVMNYEYDFDPQNNPCP